MWILRYILGIYAVVALALGSPSLAQTTAKVIRFPDTTSIKEIQEKCPNMSIIKIDDEYQCQALPAVKVYKDGLDSIIDDMQKYDLAHSPIQAGNEGDRQALRHLPDVSKASADAATRFSQSLLTRYHSIDPSQRHGESLLNYKLLGYVLNRRLLLSSFDTARHPFTNDSGFFNMLSYATRQTKFISVDDYEAYAARLSELPRFFAQHKTNMRRGIQTGYTASGEYLPGIISVVESYSVGNPTDHAFYKPFLTYPDGVTEAEQTRLRALGEDVIAQHVLPAYTDLLTFLQQEYTPHARKQVGIGTNPLNREYYKALVTYFTSLDITPDEVHEKGLSEVKRIRAEMDIVIAKTGFEGSFKEFLAFLRTDEQFYAKTPEDLLKEAAWIAKRIDGQMPKFFGKLPRLSYGVMAVPDEIAPNYTTGRYWGGNLDNGLAGNYVVNTYDLSQRPLFNLPALTLHEGVPGHHHQISLAQELTDVPEFRQNLYPDAFGEGWGLYSEKLGVEMGIYRTEYENFGRLTYEMWRACRLVVDTGMHWKGWSREQAEQCFFENSALAPHNIRTEVERYISWPGQALSYKIGELKILELRKRAEDTLGANFDIRKFHDAVLENGGIPLNILDEHINTWIAQSLSEP